jgi:HAD superfamily hydrolase (TIGR01484 family)
MGKPFKSELLSIEEAYEWACNLDISELKLRVAQFEQDPLLIIGSGGSLSACHLASKLHQSRGQIAKAITPLELFYSKSIVNKCSILFLSASGRNTDILTSFKNAIIENPKSLNGITLSTNTPLNKLSLKLSVDSIIEFENPIGKDGFLATNSLIAFFVLLSRAYGYQFKKGACFVDTVFIDRLKNFENNINKDFTFKVLYADWSLPVAIDIESKFSEAALGNVLMTDYRNFGHGRHNWLDKRSINTAIIALITPEDKDLAEKTLALIPSNIPILKIETENPDWLGSINLLVKAFYLADLMGRIQNIDPGRPGVPDYGSKLYHLNYYKLLNKNYKKNDKVAIQKKLGHKSFFSLDDNEKNKWIKASQDYKKKINKQKFKSVIFDYDGTLCHAVDRYYGLKENMGQKINELLENNIIVGIATGRGKSVRIDLQKVINEKYWNKVIIGYYNGGEIGLLKDENIPAKIYDKNQLLESISSKLNEKYKDDIALKHKKNQLTIELKSNNTDEYISDIIKSIYIQNKNGIICVQSDHSIDVIIRPEVSKLNVLKLIQNKIDMNGYQVLCFGDKGKFPGNDFELLSHPYSLSVDEVSIDKHSCWNYGTLMGKSTDTMLYYLNKIQIQNEYFKIKI